MAGAGEWEDRVSKMLRAAKKAGNIEATGDA